MDFVYVETMNDCYETKAAVLAAKESCDLPVFVSNVYDAGGKLMSGATPEAMVAMLEGLGADVIGINCSLGPAQMLRLLPRFLASASVPVLVKPNAGLPRFENGKTAFDVPGGGVCGHHARCRGGRRTGAGRLLRHDAGIHPAAR